MAEERKQGQNTQDAGKAMRSTGDYVKIGLTVFLTFACCILLFFCIYRFDAFKAVWKSFLKAAEPIIIGLVLAYLLNPVMQWAQGRFMKLFAKRIKDEKKRRKVSRVLGIVVSMLFLVVFLAVMIAAMVPALINSIGSLLDTLPGYVEKFVVAIQNMDFANEQITEYVSNLITTATNTLEDFTTTTLLPLIQTYISQITTGVIAVAKTLINFIIGIIIAIYVMMSQETMIGQGKKVLYAVFKTRRTNLIIEIIRETDRMLGGFLRGKLVDSLVIGIICYIGCLILRMPNSLLIAVVIGVTNIIPFFGPFIGAIPCFFLVLVQHPFKALYLVIFILVLQQVDGNIIGPRILGESTGLSSFWIMVAILIGGGMFGFLGMVLGVPVMGVIHYIVRRLTKHLLHKRHLPQDTKGYIKAVSVDEDTGQIRY